MAFFVRPLTSYEEKMLNDFKDQYSNHITILKRLDIILLSRQRHKSGEIARQLKIRPATVIHWIRRFNQEGLKCFEQSFNHAQSGQPPSVRDIQPLFARMPTRTEQENLQQLITLYKDRSRTLKRLQCIMLSSQGVPVSELVEILSISSKTARLWIKQFNNSDVLSLETSQDREWLTRQRAAAIT